MRFHALVLRTLAYSYIFMNKLNILCLFGGNSTEYEVSCRSYSSVIKNIDLELFNVIEVGIQKCGAWCIYEGDTANILNLSWDNDTTNLYPCAVIPKQDGNGKAGLIKFGRDGSHVFTPIDAILPIIHGANGEDGTVQGLARMYEIPCVGSDIIGSVCSFDKELTKIICAARGIKQGKYISFRDYQYMKDRELIITRAETELGYPMFVKPANAGSSVGITKARTRAELIGGIATAFKNDRKAVIEANVKGREIEIAVLGNDDNLYISVPGEIDPNADFYDYDTKYINDTAKYFIPARLDSATAEKIKETAAAVYTGVGAGGFSRIDFFVAENGEVIFNEINTIPGFTDISMYAKLMTYDGMSYSQLITKMIMLAVNKK